MEPTRPAAANRVYDRFQELAGRLISRPLGIPGAHGPYRPMKDSFPQDCFVCRKHRGLEEVPGGAIFEDTLLFVSHAQLWGNETTHYLGHLFLEPKRHVPELAELTSEEAKHIGAFTALVARAIQHVTSANHVYSFVIEDHVPHLHVHLIGRYPGAPREYWGPRVDEWPDAPRGGPEETALLCDKLRIALLESNTRDA